MDSDEYDSIQLLSAGELVEEYYKLVQSMIEDSAEENKSKEQFDGRFSDEAAIKLKEFSRLSSIQPISEALAECLTLMERHTQKKKPAIQETAIYNALLRLEKSISCTSSWEIMGALDKDDGEGPLTNINDFEINVMEHIISTYTEDLLSENSSRSLFFPVTDLHEPSVVVKWRILEKIASVKITAEKTIYKQKLAEYMKCRIEKEVDAWLQSETKELKLLGKNSALKDVETLTNTLKDLYDHLTNALDAITLNYQLFSDSGVSYMEAVASALDIKLYHLCQKVMKSMDDYQTSHKDFHVNLRDSCALSHTLYRQLKKIVTFIKNEDGESLCHELSGYYHLFAGSFLHLLHVLKSECHFRIKRAVEDESKDSIHTEEKILSSSVIVLNCFCTVIDEWKHLEIEDEELKTAFLIKVTDIICDGAKIFAEALERRWRSSSDIPLKGTDQAKKACTLANSIEHVLQYLRNLPVQMSWEESLSDLKGDSASVQLREQILRILNLIHNSMDSHVRDIEDHLVKTVVDHSQHRCEKFLFSWLHAPVASQNVDKLLNCLNDDMDMFHTCLREDIFPRFLHQLWTCILTFIKNNFQEGQPPEYAKVIAQNLNELKDFFESLQMKNSDVSRALYEQICEVLSLSSKTTVELQLDYYSQLAELMISPLEYLGHIAFQAGYKSTSNGIVDLYVNVQKGQRLAVRKFDLSELYVKVELCPSTMFPSQFSLKSQPNADATENPIFNELFQFTKLPRSLLSVKGAVIQVLVLNQDRSYSAEAVLQLTQVQNMSGVASLEFLPVYLMPLRKFDMSHISFQVLVSRSRWDRSAKMFIKKRNKVARTQKKFLTCLPGKSAMCHFGRGSD